MTEINNDLNPPIVNVKIFLWSLTLYVAHVWLRLIETGEWEPHIHSTVLSSNFRSMGLPSPESVSYTTHVCWYSIEEPKTDFGQIISRSPISILFLSQLYVALSWVRKAQYVLLLHKEDDNPQESENFHQTPVVLSNPILPEAVRFAEGN